jgi:hypothetical protein
MSGIPLRRHKSGLYLPYPTPSLPRWGFYSVQWKAAEGELNNDALSSGMLLFWGGDSSVFPTGDVNRILDRIFQYVSDRYKRPEQFLGFFRIEIDGVIRRLTEPDFFIEPDGSGGWETSGAIDFTIGPPYLLRFGPSSPVNLKLGTTPILEIQKPSSGPGFKLFRLDNSEVPFGGPLSIPLTKTSQIDQTATFNFALPLTSKQLTDLGFGLRYSYARSPASTQAIGFLDFTFLKPIANQVNFDATIDPASREDPNRSSFAIPRTVTRRKAKRQSAPQLFHAALANTHGIDLVLSATDASHPSRFVFATYATSTNVDHLPALDEPWFVWGDDDSDKTPHYNFGITPDGIFDLLENPENDAAPVPLLSRANFGVLSGFSDREYLPIRKNDRISFRIGGGSYDPQLRKLEPNSLNQPLLFGDRHGQGTSWIAVVDKDNNDVTRLVSESTDFALYNAIKDRNLRPAQSSTLSGAYDPISLSVRTDQGTGFALPVVPYLAVPGDIDGTLLEDFEKQAVAPFRRSLVAPVEAERSIRSSRTNFTPLNFLVQRNGVTVDRLLLAKAQEPSKTGDGILDIRNVAPELADLLERDELFMVITGLDNYGTMKASVEIAGWGFDVDMTRSSTAWDRKKPGQVVIIKGARGKLLDLVDADSAWTGRGIVCPREMKDFGGGDVRALLEPKLDGTSPEANQALDAAFADLRAILDDADWMGVIVLRCPINSRDLPDQIRGVLGGINDPSLFLAHHLALRLNRLQSNGGSPSIGSSPLFGVVDYFDKAADPKPSSSGPIGNQFYALAVSRMVVGFSNSKVSAFFAELWLQTAGFFEALAKESKRIVIFGSHESRIDAAGKTLDVYKFVADGEYTFRLAASKFIATVECHRVTLAAMTSGSSTHIVTRLAVDGFLTFGASFPTAQITLIDPIDHSTGNPKKFGFTDMGIEFEFDTVSDTDGWHPTPPDFFFRPSGLSIDLGDLQTDANALLSRLPFRFRKFEWWKDDGLGLGDLGYLSFGKLGGDSDNGNPDGIQTFPDNFKYGLTFDLNLGTLGSLGSKLKEFQLRFLLGWKEEQGKTTFALGFKFDGSGGENLDIGIGNLFRLKAEYYGIDNVDTGKGVYVIYAYNAKLVAFGKEIPDSKFSLFVFADPNNSGQIGWFLLMRKEKGSAGNIIDLDLIGGGQRIDVFDKNARSVKDLIDNIKTGFEDFAKNNETAKEGAFQKTLIEKIKDPQNKLLRYAPEHEWTVFFDTAIAEFLNLQFAARDPDLYGIHVGIKQLQIDLDILYRKLSEDLGVYSIEFVPPDFLRTIDVGAVTIVLPAIGVDIYTDGGFRIDLGFPYNHNWARSFVAEVIPFTGSAGIYYAQISGLGSRLIPAPKDTTYEYNPVIEAGFSGSFGLGKTLNGGIFRAQVKLEIYSMLEGSHGTLRTKPKRGKKAAVKTRTDLKPADSFVALRGTLGIHGHVEGVVDFGITKARAWVDLYVEMVITLRTDDHIPVTFTVGVSIGFEWVIARIETWFGTFEIKIYLSFSTTISYSWILGNRRENFDDIYVENSNTLAIGARHRDARVLDRNPPDEAYKPIKWAADFTPAMWRVNAQKCELPLIFNPDLTFADHGFDDIKAVTGRGPAFVPLLWGETRNPDSDATGDPGPMEELVVALTAWAVRSVLQEKSSIDDPVIDRSVVITVMRRLLGGDELHEPDDTVAHGPAYSQLTKFLADNFVINIQTNKPAHLRAATEFAGALFPMPSDIRMATVDDAGQRQEFDLWEAPLVDDPYIKSLREFFRRFAIEAEQQEDQRAKAVATSARSFVSVLMEEHFELLLRGGVSALLTALLPYEKAGTQATLSQLLAGLIKTAKDTDRSPSPRLAATATAAATRFFMHGLRLPLPPEVTAFKNAVEPRARSMIADAKDDAAPIFAAAGLQHDLSETSRQIQLSAATGVTWFTVSGSAAVAELTPGALEASTEAYKTIYQDTLKFSTGIRPGWTARPNRYAPLSRLGLGVPPTKTCLLLPADLVESDGEFKDEKWAVYAVDPDTGKQKLIPSSRAIAVPIRIRQVYNNPTNGRNGGATNPDPITDVYEIVGAVEDDRRLLDRLPTHWKAASIDLYATTADGDQTKQVPINDSNQPIVIRGNLSVEPGLDAPNGSNLLGIAETSGTANSAWMRDEKEKFVELIRFASVTNSGGFFLLSNAQEIKNIFGPTSQTPDRPQGALALPRLLMVIQCEDTAAAPANALLLDGLFDKDVLAIEAGELLRSAMLPGLLPLQILLDDPAWTAAWTFNDQHREIGTFESLKPKIITDEGWGTLPPDQQDKQLRDLIRTTDTDRGFRGIDIVRADILTRFTMLDFDVTGSDFSVDGYRTVLPVGPTKKFDDDPVPEKFLGYALPIPLAKFLNSMKGDPTDPYGAVGKGCTIKFSLRDVYGNRIGVGSDFAIRRVTYSDAILPFWQVRGMALRYEASKTERAVIITLHYELQDVQADDKTAAIGSILRDLTTSMLQIFTPGVIAGTKDDLAPLRSGIALNLQTTLLDNQDTDQDDIHLPGMMELPGGARIVLRNFLNEVKNKLQAALNGNGSVAAFDRPMSIPLSSKALASGDYIPVSAGLLVSRPEEDVDQPSIRTMQRVIDITAAYRVNSGSAASRSERRTKVVDNNGARDNFARQIAKLWPQDGKYLPAVGRAARPGGNREVIWLVRRELAQPKAIGAPIFAAPLPLANTPVSFYFSDIPVFNSTETTTWNVRDADMEMIGKTMASRIDASVSPRIAGRLLRWVRDNQQTDLPAVRDALENILQCKQVVAEHFSGRIEAAYRRKNDEDKKAFAELKADAARDFAERLKRRLGSYFDIDTSLSHKVTWDLAGAQVEPASAPHIYMKVSRDATNSKTRRVRSAIAAPDFSTDQAPLPVNATKAFSLFINLNPSDQLPDISPIEPPRFASKLGYQVTHVQRIRYPTDARSVEGRKTQWLELIAGQNDGPQIFDIEIPVIKRELPKPVAIVQQRASATPVVAGGTFDARVRLARQWRFGVDWTWPENLNNQLELKIGYNSLPNDDLHFQANDERLREHIAHFVARTDGGLWDALMNLSNGKDGVTARHVAAFVNFGTYAEIFRRDIGSSLRQASIASSDFWNDSFTMELNKPGQRLNVTPAYAGGKRPRGLLEYDPATFGTQRKDKLTVTKIDVLEGVSAWSGFKVSSNFNFNDEFIYVIDGVRAGSALVPHIYRSEVFDITATLGPKTLAQWLSRAFVSLFEDGTKLLTDVEILYRSEMFERSGPRTVQQIRGKRTAGTPVAKLAAIPVYSTADIDELSRLVSATSADWVANNHIPVQTKNGRRQYLGQLRFRITVFSEMPSAVGAPVIRYDDVVLPLSKVLIP